MLGERNLLAAREEAMLLRPWYGPILSRFLFVKRESKQPLFHDHVGRVYYNDGYASFANVDTLVVHLLQITEMFARGLQWRRFGRDPQVWSFACLLDTASSLKKQGFALPRESLKPQWFRFPDNKPAEYYYRRLEQLERVRIPFTAVDDRGRPQSVQVEVYWEDGQLKLTLDDAAIPGLLTDEEGGLAGIDFLLDPLLFSGIQEEVWDLAAEFGDQFAGDIPDWLIRQSQASESILPWHEHLRMFLGDQIHAGDSTRHSVFTMPSLLKSILPRGTVLPHYQGRSPSVAIVVDTSGSMDKQLLSRALGEIDGVLRALEVDDGLTVIPCDAAAHTVQKVFIASQLDLEGGGGTSLAKGLDRAAELLPPPEGVIVITDGYTPWPKEPPEDFKVLVVIVSKKWPEPAQKKANPVPEWAEVVEMFPYRGKAA